MSESTRVRAVTVYCSSSSRVDPAYFDAARGLGLGLARAGMTLVYGGNRVGLMGAVADAARAAGGRVVGITPQVFVDHGVHDTEADELVVTPDMRSRKAILESRGDAFAALPGGLGTLEELFEVMTGRQLRYHDKPIVIVNINNYFAPLLAMIEHGIEQQFIKPAARSLFFVAGNVEEAIEHLRHDDHTAGTAAVYSHEFAIKPSGDRKPTDQKNT